jgi:hypothetical protein
MLSNSRAESSFSKLRMVHLAFFCSSYQDYKMEKPSNDLFDSSFASFDHRSEAFRQKMFEHFLAKRSELWLDFEEILENNEPAKPV